MTPARPKQPRRERFGGSTVGEALAFASKRYPDTVDRKQKKNFAQTFSECLATVFANALRPAFPGVSPDQGGAQQERPARTAKGFKRLDVNYSTSDLGMALGVSIKTINARDAESGRYTKNFTRVDAELRAEATDYHRRQPFAVLVAIIFLPIDACDDAGKGTKKDAGTSSFGAAVRSFRSRAGRRQTRNDYDAFERVFVGLYDRASGSVRFLDVESAPPRSRRLRPDEGLSFEDVIEVIRRDYDQRNDPPFEWAE